MTNVKPATDYMVGSIQKAHRHCSTTECGDVLVLLARIDADREENASVRKAAASKDRLIEQQAAEIAALKAKVDDAETIIRGHCKKLSGVPLERAEYKEEIQTLRDANAALKAEVERLTPAFLPCHVCGGKGISDIIHGAVVRCENCAGTGRAR